MFGFSYWTVTSKMEIGIVISAGIGPALIVLGLVDALAVRALQENPGRKLRKYQRSAGRPRLRGSDRLSARIFDGQRFELIDGELFDKTGQNPPHAYAVRAVNAWLNAIYPRNTVLVQLPIEAGTDDRETSLPEPDLAVIAEDKNEYKTRHARGDEVLLVIEVADTSLRQDMLRKRDL